MGIENSVLTGPDILPGKDNKNSAGRRNSDRGFVAQQKAVQEVRVHSAEEEVARPVVKTRKSEKSQPDDRQMIDDQATVEKNSISRAKRSAPPIRARRRRDDIDRLRHTSSGWIGFVKLKSPNWKRAIADPLAYLPLAIAIVGAAFAYAVPQTSAMSAIVTIITAALCMIALQITPLLRPVVNSGSSMHQRFEELEDMAWELHESEERYRTLAETFGDLLVLRDANGKITYCNQAYCKLLELEKSEILKKQILPPGMAKAMNAATGNPAPASRHGTEVVVNTSSGDRWYHWLDLPVRDERSGKTGTLSLARDITIFKNIANAEADARRKAEQATRAKSRFLAMVSHEMRTPLNGILGMSRLLGDTKLDKEQENYLNALSHSGQSLLGLINDMLDMTMIEAGRFSLNKQKFSPAELVRETGEVLSQKAYEKGIEFAIFIDEKCMGDIVSDPERVRQVITNLVGNAIKFTKTGGVSLTCRIIENTENGKARIVVEVADTGPGISSKDAKRIFSEFERIDNEASRKVDGAGLGLAIAKALAEQLGGTLELASTGRNGSVFRFTLPCGNGQVATDEELDEPASYDHSAAALIVSKNPMEAEALSTMLSDMGVTASVARTMAAIDRELTRADTKPLHILFDPEKWRNAKKLETRLKGHVKDSGRFTKLIRPGEGGSHRDTEKHPAEAWLVRPVRRTSLNAILAGCVDVKSQTPFIQTPDEAEANPAVEPAGKAQILLAEDNDINALLVVSALKRRGYAVDRARDGREAVELFKARQADKNITDYQLVLMDMQMPVMDGTDAIKAIRASEKAGQALDAKPVSIHVLSADEQEASRKAALASGADGFIVKPVDPAQLVELADMALVSAKAE